MKKNNGLYQHFFVYVIFMILVVLNGNYCLHHTIIKKNAFLRNSVILNFNYFTISFKDGNKHLNILSLEQ